MSEATPTANGSADGAEGVSAGAAAVTDDAPEGTESVVVTDAVEPEAALDEGAAGGGAGDVVENGVVANVDGGVAAEAGGAQPIFSFLMFVEAPELASIVAAFREHFAPARQFSSCVGEDDWVRKEDLIEDSYHFREEHVADEAAATVWASKNSCEPLEAGRPGWCVTVLRAALPARTAVVVRFHRRVCDGFGDSGAELAALESSFGASLHSPPPKEAERRGTKRPARSPSPKKEAPRKTNHGQAKQQAREAMDAMDLEKRDPVPAKQAWKVAIDACQELIPVNTNKQGGVAQYHECRLAIYSALLDLPPGVHQEWMKERMDHMAQILSPKSPGSYRAVSREMIAYLSECSP